MNAISLYGWKCILFIHLWANGCWVVLSVFRLLWIVPLWTFMCKFLCGCGFISLVYIPSIRIGGSHGNTIVILWRSYQTIFQRDCTILHSYQQCMKFYCSWIEPIYQMGENWSFYNAVWRRKWQPTPALLPGKSHGRRSLVGYGPWGRKELEWLSDFTYNTVTTDLSIQYMSIFCLFLSVYSAV